VIIDRSVRALLTKKLVAVRKSSLNFRVFYRVREESYVHSAQKILAASGIDKTQKRGIYSSPNMQNK